MKQKKKLDKNTVIELTEKGKNIDVKEYRQEIVLYKLILDKEDLIQENIVNIERFSKLDREQKIMLLQMFYYRTDVLLKELGYIDGW